MKHISVLLFFCMTICFTFAQTQTDTIYMYFAFGKYNMTETEWLRCDSLINAWQYVELQSVEIEGHTDIVSSKAFNETLSKQRAETVYEYLWKKGVSKNIAHIAAYDFSRPTQNNKTDKGRSANRRVEIRAVYTEKKQTSFSIVPQVEVKVPPSSYFPKEVIGENIVTPSPKTEEVRVVTANPKETIAKNDIPKPTPIFPVVPQKEEKQNLDYEPVYKKENDTIFVKSGEEVILTGKKILVVTGKNNTQSVFSIDSMKTNSTVAIVRVEEILANSTQITMDGMEALTLRDDEEPLISAGMMSVTITDNNYRPIAVKGCQTFFVPNPTYDPEMQVYVSNQDTVRGSRSMRWSQSQNDVIRYDTVRKGYVVTICGDNTKGVFKFNIDKWRPGAIIMRIRVPHRKMKNNIRIEYPNQPGNFSIYKPLKVRTVWNWGRMKHYPCWAQVDVVIKGDFTYKDKSYTFKEPYFFPGWRHTKPNIHSIPLDWDRKLGRKLRIKVAEEYVKKDMPVVYFKRLYSFRGIPKIRKWARAKVPVFMVK